MPGDRQTNYINWLIDWLAEWDPESQKSDIQKCCSHSFQINGAVGGNLCLTTICHSLQMRWDG
jgi:hypothetical protein